MSEEKRESIRRAIELKELAEKKALNEQQDQELRNWQLRNSELAKLSVEQLNEELKKPAEAQEVDIKSSHKDEILADYKKQFGHEKWYQEPKVEDGKVSLLFPSKEEAANFFQGQAELNRPFVVVDAKTNQVMAYSNGDGTLYHGDGRPFNKGDELTPCGKDAEQFKMPRPAFGAHMTPMQEITNPQGAMSETREDMEEKDDHGLSSEDNYDDSPRPK